MNSHAAKLARLLCGTAVLLAVTVSPMALQAAGIYYDSDGGNPIAKFHLATYFIALALVFHAFDRLRGVENVASWLRERRDLLIYVMTGVAVLAYEVAVHGTPGIGLLVDSFVAPSILILILIDSPISFCRKLAGLVIVLLILNAVIGVGELATHARLFPYRLAGRIRQEDFFRPTALGGHPVNNGMMTAAALMALTTRSWPLAVRLACAGILLLGLVAFGVRLPILFGVAGSSFLVAANLNAFVRRGPAAFGLTVWVATMLVSICTASAWIVYLGTNFGTRLRNAPIGDTSTSGHLQALDIFTSVRLPDFLIGYSWQDILDMKLASHVEAIESFWIVILLYIGLMAFLVWIAGMMLGLRALFRDIDVTGRTIIVCTLLMASVNVSLASKGTLLIVIFALSLGTLKPSKHINMRRSRSGCPVVGGGVDAVRSA